MRIAFTKMTGAGNDFVVIDNRTRLVKSGSKTARKLCDRRWGIGADGLLLLERSKLASYKMLYYNADGSSGGMCGNGGRCVARFAAIHRIAPKTHRFEALDFMYFAMVRRDKVVLSMKDPRNLRVGRKVKVESRELTINSVQTGSPHLVIDVNQLSGFGSLRDVDVVGLGRKLRFHRGFAPHGTNVNFVQRHGANSIRIRTYERGVEDETLSCGTGSIASAIVASRLWGMKSPVEVIPLSEMPLEVAFEDEKGAIRAIQLSGPADVVFTGMIEV